MSRIDKLVVEEILAGDPVLTPAEVREQLGLTPHQLDALAAGGAIRTIQVAKHRRFRQSAVTAYTRDNPQPPPQ
jgi:hypothetical protein